MPKLKIIQNGITRELVFDGERPLYELLAGFGVHIDKPCGGRGVCKKCTVLVNGREELACRYTVSGDAVVEVPKSESIESLLGVAESEKLTENLCLCLDIGTTTLALALVSLDDKTVVKTKTSTNPQRSVGADVISRIEYCSKNGALSLQAMLLTVIKEMVDSMLDGYKVKSVEKMYVAGNTAMLHLFFGVDCSALGISPYIPNFLGGKCVSGDTLGLSNVAKVTSLPCISAFVGADILAGLGCVDMPEDNKYSLLVDLGTNAETVLFNRDKYLCATAAAGPCFEGVNISSGMSATDGAIYAYRGGKYLTVGNTMPKGICATGLIDVIAELVKSGIVDESGYMEDDFELSDGVAVTPKDIREFQLAKSAVISAIECLLRRESIGCESIEKIYVAGGFAAKLNIENAAYIGLFPKALVNRFVPINNSSLLGTVKFALTGNDLAGIAARAEFIDIGADPDFSELFFKNMTLKPRGIEPIRF